MTPADVEIGEALETVDELVARHIEMEAWEFRSEEFLLQSTACKLQCALSRRSDVKEVSHPRKAAQKWVLTWSQRRAVCAGPAAPASPTVALSILRPEDMLKKLSISRSTLWRWDRSGQLPAKVRIGRNIVGWLESDIEEWWQRKVEGRAQ